MAELGLPAKQVLQVELEHLEELELMAKLGHLAKLVLLVKPEHLAKLEHLEDPMGELRGLMLC